MVFVDVPVERQPALKAHLATAGVRVSTGYMPQLRLVTHLDVDDAGIATTLDAFARFPVA
jgi:threonine aldolase